MARIKTLHGIQRESLSEPGGWPVGLSVGILGGGQLARMLAESAARMGLDPVVYTTQTPCPATRLGMRSVVGSIKDIETLRRFLTGVRWCVFESEFVSTDMLKLASMGVDVNFFPPLPRMADFQDKIRQKQCCKSLQISTAPFEILPEDAARNREKTDTWVENVAEKFSNACVFKWGRMGYDGKGVFIMSSAADLAAAQEFCRSAVQQKLPLYAEQKIAFKRELAIIGCYSTSGEFTAYPLVVSEQKDGICDRVYGPASALGVSAAQEMQAREAARNLAENYNLFGCFGIEFFETAGGELLVNEIAPRVHNTGHYTQDACATSQFENHWRAVLGLPLGDVRAAPAFAMNNLLGPDGVSLARADAALPVPGPHAHLHWYDKEEILPRRKVGHVNGTIDAPERLPELLSELDRCRGDWQTALRKIQEDKSHA